VLSQVLEEIVRVPQCAVGCLYLYPVIEVSGEVPAILQHFFGLCKHRITNFINQRIQKQATVTRIVTRNQNYYYQWYYQWLLSSIRDRKHTPVDFSGAPQMLWWHDHQWFQGDGKVFSFFPQPVVDMVLSMCSATFLLKVYITHKRSLDLLCITCHILSAVVRCKLLPVFHSSHVVPMKYLVLDPGYCLFSCLRHI